MTGVVFSFLEQAFCVFILLQINRNAATHNSSVNVGEKLREKAIGISGNWTVVFAFIWWARWGW